MKKRLQYWRFLGLSRDTVNSYSDRVFTDNLNILCSESLLTGIMFLIISCILLLYGYDFFKLIAFFFTTISCFVIYLISANLRKEGSDKMTSSVSWLIVVFTFIIYFLVIFIGTYRTANYAALMVGAIVILSVSFDNFPISSLLIHSFGLVLFLCLSYHNKETEVFLVDALNTITVFILGQRVMWIKAKNKWEHKEALELMERNNSKLYNSSLKDPLTGLLTRRNAFERLEVCAAQSNVSHKTMVCMIMDLDLFKKHNDTYGHPEGDRLLAEVGKLLLEIQKKYGLLFSRIGGEEFMTFWMPKSENEAKEIANEILEAVRNIPHPESQAGKHCTISIGIYENVAGTSDTGSRVYSKADRALYEAKKNGRDRMEFYDNHLDE